MTKSVWKEGDLEIRNVNQTFQIFRDSRAVKGQWAVTKSKAVRKARALFESSQPYSTGSAKRTPPQEFRWLRVKGIRNGDVAEIYALMLAGRPLTKKSRGEPTIRYFHNKPASSEAKALGERALATGYTVSQAKDGTLFLLELLKAWDWTNIEVLAGNTKRKSPATGRTGKHTKAEKSEKIPRGVSGLCGPLRKKQHYQSLMDEATIVRDREDFEYAQSVLSAAKLISVDIETVDIIDARPATVQIATSTDAFLFDLVSNRRRKSGPVRLKNWLKPGLSSILSDARFVLTHGHCDQRWLADFGVETAGAEWIDTGRISRQRVLAGEKNKWALGLVTAKQKFHIRKKKCDWGFDRELTPRRINYAIADAVILIEFADRFLAK